jgi:magnesium transporter
MIRSFAFTTQGRLHSKDIEVFLMPTLLADTNLFLWVDLEKPSTEEAKRILEGIFHFHPLSIEDCIGISSAPKVEEYQPKDGDLFSPYLFMVIHAVDYSRKDGVFATSELNFFLGKNFLVTYHDVPLRSIQVTEERCLRGTMHIARAPDRVAHTLLDGIVENYKPALEELSLEIAALEDQVVENPTKKTLNKLIKIKKEVLHLRQIIGPAARGAGALRRRRVQADPPTPRAVLPGRLRRAVSDFDVGADLHGFADEYPAGLPQHVVEPNR